MRPFRIAGKSFVRALCVVLALGWAGATHARVGVWRSEVTLWADAAAKAPSKPRPTVNYGRALELAGDFDGAIVQFQHAIALAYTTQRSPAQQRFAMAAGETNIAHVYLRQGKAASAMRILDSTLSWYPDWPYGHFNRGAVLWMVGACDEAVAEMRIGWAYDGTLPVPSAECGAWR